MRASHSKCNILRLKSLCKTVISKHISEEMDFRFLKDIVFSSSTPDYSDYNAKLRPKQVCEIKLKNLYSTAHCWSIHYINDNACSWKSYNGSWTINYYIYMWPATIQSSCQHSVDWSWSMVTTLPWSWRNVHTHWALLTVWVSWWVVAGSTCWWVKYLLVLRKEHTCWGLD